MRILLVHKSLRLGGGADQVALNQWRWLEEAGHEVIPFGMRHPDNRPSPYERYWVRPVDFEQPTPGQLINLLWSREAAGNLRALLAHVRPDVALLHNIYHQLSPSILRVLRRAGVRVALYAHDYKLICPNYRLFTSGAPCSRCVTSHAWHAVLHRCVKDSLMASGLAAIETSLHRITHAYSSVQTVIAPSEFMRRWLVQGGWPPERIAVVPHGIDVPAQPFPRPADHGDAFLFAGRLVPEKGLWTLLSAASELPHVAIEIAGSGPLEARLQEKAPANVTFLGQLTSEQVTARRQRAVAELVPSLWYEAFGMSALEAMAQGLPVIGSETGGLIEIIDHEETGLLLPPGDVAAWKEALARLWADRQTAANLGSSARLRAEARFGRVAHLDRLLAVLQGQIGLSLSQKSGLNHGSNPV